MNSNLQYIWKNKVFWYSELLSKSKFYEYSNIIQCSSIINIFDFPYQLMENMIKKYVIFINILVLGLTSESLLSASTHKNRIEGCAEFRQSPNQKKCRFQAVEAKKFCNSIPYTDIRAICKKESLDIKYYCKAEGTGKNGNKYLKNLATTKTCDGIIMYSDNPDKKVRYKERVAALQEVSAIISRIKGCIRARKAQKRVFLVAETRLNQELTFKNQSEVNRIAGQLLSHIRSQKNGHGQIIKDTQTAHENCKRKLHEKR